MKVPFGMADYKVSITWRRWMRTWTVAIQSYRYSYEYSLLTLYYYNANNNNYYYYNSNIMWTTQCTGDQVLLGPALLMFQWQRAQSDGSTQGGYTWRSSAAQPAPLPLQLLWMHRRCVRVHKCLGMSHPTQASSQTSTARSCTRQGASHLTCTILTVPAGKGP